MSIVDTLRTHCPTPDDLCTYVLVPENGYIEDCAWQCAYTHTGPFQGWKAHIYADSPEDWLEVAYVVLPYLHQYRIAHKTVSSMTMLDAVTQHPMQRGKAFTLYTPTVDLLGQVLLDLDQQLITAGLSLPDTVFITGDRGIAESGRLFYRYDLDMDGQYRANDGNYKPDDVVDPFEG
jgi:hypothetical protein